MKTSHSLPWSLLAAGVCTIFGVTPAKAVDGEIIKSNAGTIDWNTGTNWRDSQIADGVGATATIHQGQTGGTRTIVLPTSRTLGILDIQYNRSSGTNTLNYTFSSSSDPTATLTIDNGGNGGLIKTSLGVDVTVGTTTLSLPVLLADSLTLDNSHTGALTIGGGISASTSGTKTITNSGVVSGASANVTISGPINDGNGVVSIRQNSTTSFLTLTGNNPNTYSGGTYIDAGVLIMASGTDATLGAGGVYLNSGTFRNTVSLQTYTTRTLNVGASGGALDTVGFLNWSGVVSGEGALTKLGNSTLSLNNSGNTHAGGIFVEQGVLRVRNDGAFGALSNNVTFANGTTFLIQDSYTAQAGRTLILTSGTVNFDIRSDFTWQGTIEGNAGFAKVGTAMLTLTGSNTYVGSNVVNQGTLRFTADENLGDLSNRVVLNNAALRVTSIGNSVGVETNRSLEVNGNVSIQTDKFLNWTGDISGTGTINKLGSSTLSLNHASNTFVGDVTVSAGVLRVRAGDGSLGAENNDVILNDNTTFRVHGYGSVPVSTFNANRTLNLVAGSVTVDALSTAVWTGTITGAAALVKTGSSTFVASGVGDYTGGLQITAGTLLIDGDHSQATGDVLVASGATLGGTGIIGGSVTVDAGAQLAPGNDGTGLLTVSNLLGAGAADLTLNPTSTALFEIGGYNRGSALGGFDALDVEGTLTFDGTLTIAFVGGFLPSANDSFDLFNFGFSAGNFTSVTFLDSGIQGNFDAATGSLTITMVPEPSVVALIGLGATMALFRKRRNLA